MFYGRFLVVLTSLFLSVLCLGSPSKYKLDNLSLTSKRSGKFIIKGKIDLSGETVLLPDGSKLIFRGGSLDNGTISGNEITIKGARGVVFGPNLRTEFVSSSLDANWYGSLIQALVGNRKCHISINSGEYVLSSDRAIELNNSLYGQGDVIISHKTFFVLGDNVTVEGISWDGQDVSPFWMYSQPNNLVIRHCSFKNYYGATSGVVFYSHGKKDTYGLVIENCIFDRLGTDGNGIEGDMIGSSFAISTYRCHTISIRNNVFQNQYGQEDSDAIKLEGESIIVPEKFPVLRGETYKYAAVNAIIEGNSFINVPKSPIKLFASGVVVKGNDIRSSRSARCGLVRVFRSENIVVERNSCTYLGPLSNFIQIWASKGVYVKDNELNDTNTQGRSFSKLIDVEYSKDILFDSLSVVCAQSSYDESSCVFSLKGEDIVVTNSSVDVYSSYSMLSAQNEGRLVFSKNAITVRDSLQYSFLINNNSSDNRGSIEISDCSLSLPVSCDASQSAFGYLKGKTVEVNNVDMTYDKTVTFSADDLKIVGSRLSRVNIARGKRATLSNVEFLDTYNPISVESFDADGELIISEVNCPKPITLAIIRFRNNVPTDFIYDSSVLNSEKAFHFDKAEKKTAFIMRQ